MREFVITYCTPIYISILDDRRNVCVTEARITAENEKKAVEKLEEMVGHVGSYRITDNGRVHR